MSEGDDLGETLRKALTEALEKEKAAHAVTETELAAARRRIAELEGGGIPPRSAKPPPPMPTPDDATIRKALEETVAEIKNLRELLVKARVSLSELQAEEVALSKKRAKVLDDACLLLAEAVGESGKAPPPIPGLVHATQQLPKFAGVGPKRRGSLTIDISEVAELLESLRPPAPPKID